MSKKKCALTPPPDFTCETTKTWRLSMDEDQVRNICEDWFRRSFADVPAGAKVDVNLDYDYSFSVHICATDTETHE